MFSAARLRGNAVTEYREAVNVSPTPSEADVIKRISGNN
jgi:hypothetical protein